VARRRAGVQRLPGGTRRAARYLSSASQAGHVASKAGAGKLVLTHLMPGTDPDDSVLAAAEAYAGPIAVASPGLIADTDR
jgi:ribonuclease BN (tRNA processing enzyme)